MEIKDRILQLLKAERMSASKFADSIGVQRSNVSHVLSGRNNPSLDFIQRILNTFPNIEPEWILLGKGEIYRKSVLPGLFDRDDIKNSKILTDNNIPKGIEKSSSLEINPPEVPVPENIRDLTSNPGIQIETGQIENSRESKSEGANDFHLSVRENVKEKKISRIVIFYDDRTFYDYRQGE